MYYIYEFKVGKPFTGYIMNLAVRQGGVTSYYSLGNPAESFEVRYLLSTLILFFFTFNVHLCFIYFCMY